MRDNNAADYGPQPLGKVMESLKLKSEDLVKSSGEQLTFKQVQKACRGHKLTPNIKGKILRALNKCTGEKNFKEKDIFNR